MRDHDVDALVSPIERRRGQVVHPGKVGASEPVDRELRQLVQCPVILAVALPELLNVEVAPHRRRVYIQRPGEEVLPHLRVVLCLLGLGHQIRRAYRHAVGEVGFLMLNRIQIVDVAVLILIRSGDEGEEAVIVDHSGGDLHRVLHVPVSETIRIVAGGRDPDDQPVGVGLAGFLEPVVLGRALICRDFVGDHEVAVE